METEPRQLALPISVADCNDKILTPALELLPPAMDTPLARKYLIAIALQESRLNHRRQIKGPARGLWQFERGGGVHGVMRHPASNPMASKVCLARGVRYDEWDVYHRLEDDDVLAACFARLLLWTDPRPLVDGVSESWDYYLRTWRPGKPHPGTWAALWARADEVMR